MHQSPLRRPTSGGRRTGFSRGCLMSSARSGSRLESKLAHSCQPTVVVQLLRQLCSAARRCRTHASFSRATNVANLCRSTWAAYLRVSDEEQRKRLRRRIETGFRRGISAMTKVAGNFARRERLLAKGYVEDVVFRLYLSAILNGQGTWAAIAEMRSRCANRARSQPGSV
jgi:hypothetical protein